MKLLLCFAAIGAASPFLDGYLEPREAGQNTLGQPMGAMPGTGDVAGSNTGAPKPPSQRGRPTLSSLLEKLDTLLGGAIAARDLGDFDELEELVARAKLEGLSSSSFRPINRTPVREPGRIPNNIKYGTVVARDIDDLEEFEFMARDELEGGLSFSKPVNKFPVRRPINDRPRKPSTTRPKFRIGETMKPESIMARGILDDELWE